MAKVGGYFSRVFGPSPFSELQAHAALCIEAVEELPELFQASNQDDWTRVEQSYDNLTRLEHKADEKKRNIRSNLPKGFFLPVARADLLELLGRQDEIANIARDVAGSVLGRKIRFPASLQPQLLELVEGCIHACRKSQEVVDSLDELIDSAFRGPQAKAVVGMIEEVEALEHLTDQMVVRIHAQLFQIEEELPPVQVMFLYKALDLIAELANGAERVAHRVQMMLAK